MLDRLDHTRRRFAELLALPSSVTDEMGVPLAYYAMRPLLRTTSARRSVYDRIQSESEAKQWLAPTAAYLLRDVTDELAEAAPDGVSDAELQSFGEQDPEARIVGGPEKISMRNEGMNRAPFWAPD